jgi:type IV pilus assembly protein PilO
MAILVGAIWYACFQWVLTPRQQRVEDRQTQLENLEAQNARSRALAARKDDLEQRLTIQERQLQIFEEFIPESEEVPELLDAISNQAQMTGVELTRIRPQTVEVGEFYMKQTWELSVLGDYHDVGRYLTRIASLPRIIKPTNIQISPASRSRATRDMEAPLQVSFNIETFVLGGTTPGAQAAPGEGASDGD